ncbi:hypothetical protein AK812_SmicGene24635 [Symbiodinium microadriaticum]|uniref:Uncharacterized protein n=1 Tax=Symbiodinium microadriaticum TaxID=2951 RepID=A0A1Q9DE79_SYMMI|nr:hypothetical protein AK812_SmicGene24635 [Symbiodinium microadriaticum]CAE7948527.1 unnamed protein product [Symbiodinium sp. KB8]
MHVWTRLPQALGRCSPILVAPFMLIVSFAQEELPELYQQAFSMFILQASHPQRSSRQPVNPAGQLSDKGLITVLGRVLCLQKWANDAGEGGRAR